MITLDAKPTYRLSGLMPDTKYEFYITAVTSSNMETGKSNIVLEKTGGKCFTVIIKQLTWETKADTW